MAGNRQKTMIVILAVAIGSVGLVIATALLAKRMRARRKRLRQARNKKIMNEALKGYEDLDRRAPPPKKEPDSPDGEDPERGF